MTIDERKGIVWPIPTTYRTNDYDLANVTPEQVRTILRNVRTGKLEDQDRLFRLMLDTWPRLRKALNEVSGAVSRLKMEIKPAIREGAEDPTPQALRIHEVVERALNSYSPKPGHWELDTGQMVNALIDAYAKGISVVEIVWQNQNNIISPRCYAPVPAKYLAFPNFSNEIDRLMIAPDGANNSVLEDFPVDRFVIGVWSQGGSHPIYGANLRALTKYWLASIYGLGWLMQFAQLFGIPMRTAKTDGSEEALNKAEDMLESIGSSGWAATGPGVDFEIHSAISGSGDSLPQSHLMDVADRACDILMLGQTLTTDNTGTGSRALGDVHAGIRSEVLQSVSSWVASIVTSQLIPAIVRMNFGSVASEDMPYCEMEIPVAKDEKAIAERVKIYKEIGIAMPKQWLYDELGIPMPIEGEDVFGEEMPPDLIEEPVADLPPEIIPQEIESARADVDLRPTEEMARNASNALEVRRSKPQSERGMIAVGLARARDISNRVELSPDTVSRMVSFFSRHEVDKQGSTWDEKGKGWQAWNGWGGDEGFAWAKRKVAELEKSG
ncbi:COG4383 Mu-like prophage protein gp29 [uncultured Caudovirales phage]|uniref:COG4383 Mu-like prophage protein gp29 n=1 Tax=uncultured Caudovirales phage TaxID=2100421 RepID=A0A6J5N5Q9_9CAUD|nr:COG4383 Mu-like prophage protein gp29 [uncultured Caudovirales phage]